jgi:hypothetical protein
VEAIPIWEHRKKIMNKPDKNFRLSKTTKRMAAAFVNPQERRSFIRMMIDGELEARKPPPKTEKPPRS